MWFALMNAVLINVKMAELTVHPARFLSLGPTMGLGPRVRAEMELKLVNPLALL